MKPRSLILCALLVPTVATAQNVTPFKEVAGSTESKSCSETATAADELSPKGSSVLVQNLGPNKVFVKLGDETVTAGTANSMVLPNDRRLLPRSTDRETHYSCVNASGETSTIFLSTGNGG